LISVANPTVPTYTLTLGDVVAPVWSDEYRALSLFTNKQEAHDEARAYREGGEAVGVRGITLEGILNALNTIRPHTVLVDNKRVAPSILKGILRDALGLPIKHPRPVQVAEHDGS